MKHTKLFTAEDREVFDRIDRDCLAMHIVPPPKTFLRLDVLGPDGEPLETYEDRAHSWTRNAYNMLLNRFTKATLGTTFAAGSTALKGEASGTVIATLDTYFSSNGGIKPSATANTSNFGIVIGTGTTAESFESHNLAAKIVSGTASGQMSYGAGDAPTLSYDAGSKKWTAPLVRILNNNSGASIVVGEVGIVYDCAAAAFMFCRDVLASAVTVPNAGQLTVTYTIEMTFPA